jgi:hypothetical protein
MTDTRGPFRHAPNEPKDFLAEMQARVSHGGDRYLFGFGAGKKWLLFLDKRKTEAEGEECWRLYTQEPRPQGCAPATGANWPARNVCMRGAQARTIRVGLAGLVMRQRRDTAERAGGIAGRQKLQMKLVRYLADKPVRWHRTG